MDRKKYMAEYQRKWWARQAPEVRERYLQKQRERTRRRQATDEGKLVLRTRAKRFRDKIRADVIAAYGGACRCCGEDELVFLTIDHVIPIRRADRSGGDSSYSLYLRLRRLDYPDGYQVLCYNCNHAKATNGSCPHAEIVRRRISLVAKRGITA